LAGTERTARTTHLQLRQRFAWGVGIKLEQLLRNKMRQKIADGY